MFRINSYPILLYLQNKSGRVKSGYEGNLRKIFMAICCIIRANLIRTI